MDTWIQTVSGDRIARLVFVELKEYPVQRVSGEKFASLLSHCVEQSEECGYAGFYDRADLEDTLNRYVIGWFQGEVALPMRFSKERKEQAREDIQDVFAKCHAILPLSYIPSLFVFPCLSSFIVDRMGGATAFTPDNGNAFHVYCANAVDRERFRLLIAHEYLHLIQNAFHAKWNGLQDSIVREGVAQAFSHETTGFSEDPVAHALSRERCEEIWLKIRDILHSKSEDEYRKIFMDGEEYPLWTGYAVGYQIAKDIRARFPELSWEDLARMDPLEVIRKAGWE